MNIQFGLENLFTFINNLTAGVGVDLVGILGAGSSGLGV